MFPVVFEWGDAVLTTYSLLLSLAFFVGLLATLAGAHRYELRAAAVIEKCIGILIWGLLGARFLFVLTNWPRYASDPARLWNVAEGGVVFYGGFLAAALYVFLTSKGYRAKYFAILAPASALAHAVGRVGCFANGCCHGSQCDLPWAMVVTDPRAPTVLKGVPLHPTPLYEAVFLAILGFYLLRRNLDARKAASSVRIYLVAYGVARFLLEFTRGDTARGELLGLSTSQWISIALVLAGLSLDSKPLEGNNSPDENRNREPPRPL